MLDQLTQPAPTARSAPQQSRRQSDHGGCGGRQRATCRMCRSARWDVGVVDARPDAGGMWCRGARVHAQTRPLKSWRRPPTGR